MVWSATDGAHSPPAISIDRAAIPALVNYDAAVDWPARLECEGPFLLRVLADAPSRRVIDLFNYDRLFARGERQLPARFLSSGEGEHGVPSPARAARRRRPSEDLGRSRSSR